MATPQQQKSFPANRIVIARLSPNIGLYIGLDERSLPYKNIYIFSYFLFHGTRYFMTSSKLEHSDDLNKNIKICHKVDKRRTFPARKFYLQTSALSGVLSVKKPLCFSLYGIWLARYSLRLQESFQTVRKETVCHMRTPNGQISR